ncbi:hypothetical protein CA54_25240 [Symmachiella macrocystis]|uniref:Uncharacterized protein n=1 Tax=Symmachiella macrocystis TaxID=2527985 RepID=A0A5C6BS28_9PLAN|nr:hypothetical protein [Symmachiella macrocystis]TWU13689.1 hypothetical protein CA54_25240 [Symmachiella macrocystis]
MPRYLRILIAIPLLVILLPIVLLVVGAWLLYGVLLNVLVWICWCARGRFVLLVYSDSPHWHDYIEEHIITQLPRSTAILNWSQRRSWSWYALPVRVFRYFAGDREFNPIVIVFVPLRWAKTFRFWQPFLDHKHGKSQPLEDESRRLFSYLSQHGIGDRSPQRPQ